MSVTEPDRLDASSAESDLRELREAVLDDWLRVTSSVTDAVTEIQSTVSWRVTRPLRLTRLMQRKVSEIGVVPASRLAAVALAKRLGR
ncbi:hypothetical protein AS850_10130 [Frondihabitans sp. 762G35]|uniref:hypothetical protein n=1 Tax=Frondihabitans sp. 762G35 TaxID=1446794 RepID=UPI000D21B4A4|nr:hypothetical protein [Frondihabitans sp. 762G35]ARC57433.1 hypothetical protein AS850_10130 [Frondihabitans sp. 762G35]